MMRNPAQRRVAKLFLCDTRSMKLAHLIAAANAANPVGGRPLQLIDLAVLRTVAVTTSLPAISPGNEALEACTAKAFQRVSACFPRVQPVVLTWNSNP
jgi:hypothetical protein